MCALELCSQNFQGATQYEILSQSIPPVTKKVSMLYKVVRLNQFSGAKGRWAEDTVEVNFFLENGSSCLLQDLYNERVVCDYF